MVLADTNVIIDYWKTPDDRMTEIFNNEDIAVCGISFYGCDDCADCY